jgi:hypothetical protein
MTNSGLFAAFETSAKAEVDGVAIDVVEAAYDDGTYPTFYLARMARSNKAYSKQLNLETRQYRRDLSLMPEEKAESAMLNVFVKTVLKGWKNVRDKDGVQLSCTKEAATELFLKLPGLLDKLQAEASDIANFKTETLEQDSKN